MLTKGNQGYLLAIIALLAAIVLSVVYVYGPAPLENSGRWHKFAFECIPDAFVAIVAVPIVYWLFISRGIGAENADSRVNELPIPRQENGSSMRNIQSEVEKASVVEMAGVGTTRVLIVIDVQNDFITGTLKAHQAQAILPHVNRVIRVAKDNGVLVVFTRDWHPEGHWSFDRHGRHCVMHDPGAEISNEVEVPPESLVVNFGVNKGDTAYSALENSSLTMLLDNPRIEVVYVVGIALNYCVKCTCLSVRNLNKAVFTVDEAIASADGNAEANEAAWKELEDGAVKRLPSVDAFAKHLASNRTNRAGG